VATSITDETAGTQRFAASNDLAAAIGSATPTTGLTVGPRQVFDTSGKVTSNTVPPGALVRYIGSVTLISQNIATVNLGVPLGGFGIMPGAFILRFYENGSFDCAFPEATANVTRTFNYSVF
jgi:hypothetical protein